MILVIVRCLLNYGQRSCRAYELHHELSLYHTEIDTELSLGNRVDTRIGSLNHENSDMQSPNVRYDIYVIYLKFQLGTKRIAGYMCWFSQNHAQKAVIDVCNRRLQMSVTDVCCWVFRIEKPNCHTLLDGRPKDTQIYFWAALTDLGGALGAWEVWKITCHDGK